MDLSELCGRQQDKGNAWFELIGEIRHEGVSAVSSNRGHYFTYAKGAMGRWMKFDDLRASFMAPCGGRLLIPKLLGQHCGVSVI
jgi:hypothetical protein